MKLRNYQLDILDKLKNSDTNDLVQLDTGAGKTPIEAALADYYENCILIAHRNILITQISEKLAAFCIYHDTISTEHTRRRCMLAHRKHGHNYIKRGYKARKVASIDSLISRHRRNMLDIDTSLFWVIIIDEAHHVTSENKWGKLREIFQNARIIGFTATPARMDGESLHVSQGGIFDKLVQADSLKIDGVSKLIEQGFLSDFTVYATPHSENLKKDNERKALNIAGDPIQWYTRLAHGKRAVVMCPSIENAIEISRNFRLSGISSACIHSMMSSSEISRIIDAFVSSKILVLANVDMVGEGFDVPGIEALIMIRKTASFIAYRQWIGRALRTEIGKDSAVIIDHVGNVAEHGMPHEHVDWDIENPPKQIKFLKHAACKECYKYYEIKLRVCPSCGTENELHIRPYVGGHYITINRLDMRLVEQAKKEFAKAEQKKILETEIIYPVISYCSGTLRETIKKINIWLVETLKKENIPIFDINTFISSNFATNLKFWISNFTVNDISINNVSKAKKVFQKWKKSS